MAGRDEIGELRAENASLRDQPLSTGAGELQVLVPPDAAKRKTPRPGWEGGAYAFMRRVLATDHGSALYAKRQGMIEPVFADTKFTAASTASSAAADPQHAPNGA